MKIVYIANHDQHDNEDEIAIAYAFEQLVHTVVRIQEFDGDRAVRQEATFCLIHKYSDYGFLNEIAKRMPVVVWFFDKVDGSEDPELGQRTIVRKEWIGRVTEIATKVFCTDGDWVNEDKTGKLIWLTQGMDERKIGLGTPIPNESHDIIFTGTPHYYQRRVTHIARLIEKFGPRFEVLGIKPRQRKHGRDLSNLFASSKIVVAPDGPATDRYWSNRVYLTLGLGGFLLHPQCEKLKDQFDEGELITYVDRDHLDHLLHNYLHLADKDPEEFKLHTLGYRQRALKAIAERHLYRHRVMDLLNHLGGLING